MATRRRTLLLACALGFSATLIPASAASARAAQDPGATFGETEAVASTTALPSTTATTSSSTANQTLVETAEQPEQRLFTESRKVAAVILGLVVVALALLLLTIRYWRVTKPLPADAAESRVTSDVDEPLFVPPADAASPAFAPEPVPETESVPTATPAAAGAAEPAGGAETEPESGAVSDPDAATGSGAGADHVAADADWEPRTGEHQRIEIPVRPTTARPSAAARRKALGLPDPT